MIDWRTSRLMLLFATLMVGVLAMAIIAEVDLFEQAARLNIAALVNRIAPAETATPTPAVSGVSTTAVTPPPTFPIQHIPAEGVSPFAPTGNNG